jgi:hypothetical protein
LRLLRRWWRAREPRAVRLRDWAVDACLDLVFAVLPRERAPVFRDAGRDFFRVCRLSASFEAVVTRRAAFRIGRLPAALPATAPTTPPTTAPIGPATLPIAAPVTAPAVCFGIGGTWISSDDCELSFFSRFG